MRIIGQESIADAFGVAPKTIVEWQEAGFPVALRGGPGVPSEYDLADCIGWLVKRELRKVQEESPRDRLARLQADAIEMDNAVKRGQLLPADAIEPKIRAAVVWLREQLLGVRSTIVPHLVGKTAREMTPLLEAEHSRVLTLLANWRQADSLGDDDDEAAPA